MEVVGQRTIVSIASSTVVDAAPATLVAALNALHHILEGVTTVLACTITYTPPSGVIATTANYGSRCRSRSSLRLALRSRLWSSRKYAMLSRHTSLNVVLIGPSTMAGSPLFAADVAKLILATSPTTGSLSACFEG